LAKRRSKSVSSSDRSLFDEADPAGAQANNDHSNGNGQVVVALHEAAEKRYLNYALSVITSRALPDVRDGLKPVQRRILYTMWQQRLTADARHRKCAKVVGDVMGAYHPHGDSAIYDALVRMAQPFVMRMPLIDGSGNFGSMDGDPAAAMRYTECRLASISTELLSEIGFETVHYQPNYDGTKSEPVVLPARFCNMLVNGAAGIAVGMATNIPPHNPAEVCTALVRFLDAQLEAKELTNRQLCRWIKGPDFPTGGQILNTPDEIKAIYDTGGGSIRIRGTWEKGPLTRAAKTLHITSIPYGVNKAALVERIGEVVLSRKMPLLLDVRDLSTDDVRIALELKRGADERMVMAYLYKHTSLQTNFTINLTCLVPTENPQVGRPDRCDLQTILWHFLHFRLEVVTRRLEHELEALTKRIHILEGFASVFDALDKIIKTIRASDGKADAAEKIMARFDLDAQQTDAILELKLYRLAKLEILVIRNELKDKHKRARAIQGLLQNEKARWKIVRDEIEELQKRYNIGQSRRTRIESVGDEPEFTAEDFIIDEDAHVLVTRDGWVKRQREIKDPQATRLREGDEVLACFAGSTRATCVFFSSFGVAYTARIIDILATTGHGEPIQKLFKLKDGERIIAAFSLDPRAIGEIKLDPRHPDYAPMTHGLAATSDGYAFRFGFDELVEPSTRAGRRFARPAKGVHVVAVAAIHGSETILAATQQARAILCPAEQVNYLSGPGKGVIFIKLDKDDRLLGFKASVGDRDLLTVETTRGGTQTISTAKYEVTSRGGKGREILKRGGFVRIVPQVVSAPVLLDEG